jgi:hypothetical protein
MDSLYVERDSQQFLLIMNDEEGSNTQVYWGSGEGAPVVPSFPDRPTPMFSGGKYDDPNDVHSWKDPNTGEIVELRLLQIDDYVIRADGRTATIRPRTSRQ